MTASADKVQFLLESSLEQTLPLVKKGIFTEQQLRYIMLQRQKNQNKLYSSTYKLSHFLKAVQFEYELERQRQSKIKNQDQENVNPLFKKQGKTDFSIVRRIIKLWDRTMHKYRYRTYLWKQYLSFCIAIKSKKHFYKALTNALRFLPFELQLWKVGVRYEVQVGRNLWKARKLFHKGLKLIPAGDKNIELTKQLIKFELQFVETLQSRGKIIQGQNQEGGNDMKFIMGDKVRQSDYSQSQNDAPLIEGNQKGQFLKLREYYEVLYVALVDSISKNFKSKSYFISRPNMSAQQKCECLCDIYLKFLNDLNQNQENQLINHILSLTIGKIQTYRQHLDGMKIQEKEEDQQNVMEVQQNEFYDESQGHEQQKAMIEQISEHCLSIQEEKCLNLSQAMRQPSKQQKYASQMLQTYQETNKFDDKFFEKVIKQFCLKPLQLSAFLQPLIEYFLRQILEVMQKNEWLRIPLKSLAAILQKLRSQFQARQISAYSLYLSKQFQKINPMEYMTNVQVLKEVILFNKFMIRVEQNNKLFRSILVNCKKNIEFVQRAKLLFVE